MTAATSFTPYGHAGMHRMARMALFCLLALLCCGFRLGAAEPVTTQTIPLTAGWNLVSIQVGTSPLPIAGFAAALSAPAQLIEVWGYTPSGNPSIPGSWQTYQPKVAGFAHDLTAVQPGRGYWVKVAQFVQAKLTGIRWDGAVSLQTGWNLVGFPGLDLAPNEAMDLTSVFGSQIGRIQQVWTFDKSLGRFSGYDVTAIPSLKELSVIRPASGYWVYALDTVAVSPQPYVALPGDADASPLEPEVAFNAVNFPSLPNASVYAGTLIKKVRAASEDVAFDLNGNGIIDGPFTQDILQFEVGVDRQTITIGNNGMGAANWVLVNNVPWLFSAAADAKTYPGNVGRPTEASGVVSAERDFVTLHVDRTGLAPGTHTGSFTLYLGGTARLLQVKIEVPTASGDWKGLATTKRVNGRAVSIGEIDLGLNLFMPSDNTTETGFRAVLNQETSLLFPRDVFMNGIFFTSSQFSMTTSFGIAAGDRNAPPFDTFQQPANFDTLGAADRVRADYDANGDGIADMSNPFPYPVRREITLLGQRVNPDRLEGTYIEAITGMLPQNQAIFVEGTFYLDRRSFAPTKRSIFNEVTANAPIIIGGTRGQLFRETTLEVGSAVTISGIVLGLNLTFPDPTRLTITLFGPNGQSIVIHQGGATLPTSLESSKFNNQIGAGIWTMRVAWTPTAERGYFNNWSLNVQGLATYAVGGKIIGDLGAGNVPLQDVQVTLSGSNIIKQAATAADGTFSITGLTEDNYTLSLSRPGFQTRILPFVITNSDLYLAESGPVEAAGAPDEPMILSPVTVTTPELVAGPFIGQEPLYVTFNALIPVAQLTALGAIQTATWDFGDGAVIADTASPTDAISQTTATHTYTAAGHFAASLVLAGASGSLNVPATTIHVHRARPDATLVNGQPQTHQVLVAGFVGSIAAPLANGVGDLQIAPGSGATSQQIYQRQANGTYTATTVSGISTGIVYQESKRDTGGFDVDRSPFIPNPANPGPTDFNLTAEDGDFASRLYISGDGSPTLPFLARPFNPTLDPAGDNTPGSFLLYQPPQVNGQPIPDRFRIFVTLGGHVMNTVASEVGDFVLQPGRVEP
jgi:subtilisin-like proprotein convertase family protein